MARVRRVRIPLRATTGRRQLAPTIRGLWPRNGAGLRMGFPRRSDSPRSSCTCCASVFININTSRRRWLTWRRRRRLSSQVMAAEWAGRDSAGTQVGAYPLAGRRRRAQVEVIRRVPFLSNMINCCAGYSWPVRRLVQFAEGEIYRPPPQPQLGDGNGDDYDETNNKFNLASCCAFARRLSAAEKRAHFSLAKSRAPELPKQTISIIRELPVVAPPQLAEFPPTLQSNRKV